MKNFVIIFYSIVLLATGCISSGQNTKRIGLSSTSSIDSAHWVFTAERMLPKYGRSNVVTGGYNVSYEKNKLVVYLPYTGRAYSGAGYPSEGNPLGFTSTQFTERKEQGKKNRSIITIQPTDYPEVQEMVFTFFNNGNATLDITMSNRSGISFTGNVDTAKR